MTASSPIASSISRSSATIRSRVGSARARKISSSSVMEGDIKLSLYPVNGPLGPFSSRLTASEREEWDEMGRHREKRALRALWRISRSEEQTAEIQQRMGN